MSGEAENSAGSVGLELFQRGMTVQGYFIPVIDSSAAHRAFAEREAGPADDVQRSAGGDAQANDIAGVRRDLRFEQGDVKHEDESEQKPEPLARVKGKLR